MSVASGLGPDGVRTRRTRPRIRISNGQRWLFPISVTGASVLVHVSVILRECEARQLPLEVLEVGAGTGVMMAFFNAAESGRRGLSQNSIIARWDGLGLRINPALMGALAAQQGLALELLTGTYLIPQTGSFLENYRWWARLNLALAALVSNWPGELCWAMRTFHPDSGAPTAAHDAR